MKTKLFFLLFIGCFFFLLPQSCDKLPRNGWLDGQWQLITVDDTDVRHHRVYWRFQLDLLQFHSPTTSLQSPLNHTGVIARFKHQGETLILPQVYFMLRHQGADTLITPEMNIDLSPYGVYQVPATYRIQQQGDANRMLLTTSQHRLEFRRF